MAKKKKETNNQLWIQHSSAHVFKFGVKQIANVRCWYFPAAFASVYVNWTPFISAANFCGIRPTDESPESLNGKLGGKEVLLFSMGWTSSPSPEVHTASGWLLRGSSCHQRGSTMREDYIRLSREFFFGLMKRGNELTVFCANPGGNDYLKLLAPTSFGNG